LRGVRPSGIVVLRDRPEGRSLVSENVVRASIEERGVAMPRLRSASCALALLCVVGSAARASSPLQPLSDAEVDAAITAGLSRKYDRLISDCRATAGFGAELAAGDGIQPTGPFR